MKRFKLLTILSSLCLVIALTTSSTYSYLANATSTGVVSFRLGNMKITTDDTSENRWKYVPIDCENSNYKDNDLVKDKLLSSDLTVQNLRPGDAFEKVITITNTGTLSSKINVSKSTFLNDTVYSFKISPADGILNNKVIKVNDDSYVLEKVNPGEEFKIKLRLEVPTSITYESINSGLKTNILKNPMDMLDVTATQYSNTTLNE